MTDPTPLPIPPPETVWPPAPLQSAASLRLFVSAEGVEVSQTGGRLVLVNKFIRRFFLVECCVLSCPFASPWIRFWTSPFHRHVLSGLLPYVIWSYRLSYEVLSLILLIFIGLWYMFSFYFSLGAVVLDKVTETVKASGNLRAISAVEAVRVSRGQADVLGRQFTVRLVWSGGKPIPWWRKPLSSAEANTSFLGLFKHQANAEKVADTIAEFVGVSVQHRTR